MGRGQGRVAAAPHQQRCVWQGHKQMELEIQRNAGGQSAVHLHHHTVTLFIWQSVAKKSYYIWFLKLQTRWSSPEEVESLVATFTLSSWPASCWNEQYGGSEGYRDPWGSLSSPKAFDTKAPKHENSGRPLRPEDETTKQRNLTPDWAKLMEILKKIDTGNEVFRR